MVYKSVMCLFLLYWSFIFYLYFLKININFRVLKKMFYLVKGDSVYSYLVFFKIRGKGRFFILFIYSESLLLDISFVIIIFY